jgi:3-hydroxyisobutyrate dehydrogenase-like beta-hydroxyacid dehydrogenase
MSAPVVPPESATTPVLPRAGFIALGVMGAGIAAVLLRAGVPLTVTTRTRARAEPLLAAGARWAESAKGVASDVESGVIFAMPPEGKDLERILFGRSGVLRGSARGTLVVNLSTISPEQSRSISSRLKEREVGFLDVPVGGSAEAAAAGRLLLYVGGDEADTTRAEPYLRAFSRSIERVGPVGAGSAMKLVNNLVTLGTVELIAEALCLAETLGIGRERALEVLLLGGARSAMLEGTRQRFDRREYGVQFRLSLARKDLKLVERSASDGGQTLPVTRAVRRVYDRAMLAGRGELDMTAIFETIREGGPLQPDPGRPIVPPPSPSSATGTDDSTGLNR